jgi:hypothetical protein
MSGLRDIEPRFSFPILVTDDDGNERRMMAAATGIDGQGRRIMLTADGRAWVASPQSVLRQVRCPELDQIDRSLDDRPGHRHDDVGDGRFPANEVDETGSVIGKLRVRLVAVASDGDPNVYDDESGARFQTHSSGKGLVRQ